MRTAAAEVALHTGEDLIAAELWILKQKGVGIHYHARSTESALDGAIFKKRLLQWVELVSACQSLNGRNFLSLDCPDWRYTGTHCFIVDDNGAGTTQTPSAAEFCSRKPQIGSQNPEKLSVAFNINAGGFSVKFKTNGFFHISTLDCLV